MLGVKARALPTLGHAPAGTAPCKPWTPDESLGYGGVHLRPANPGHNDHSDTHDSHTPPMALLLCCGFQTEFLHRLIDHCSSTALNSQGRPSL